MRASGKNGETRERVHRFVRERLLSGRPPTVREVQAEFGFRSVETARGHLERLILDGRLTKRPGASRGFALPEDDPANTPHSLIPLLGRVQAGALSTAIEDPEGHVPVQARDPHTLFALRVRGDSMTGAGILDGDLVIVRSQPTANSGDIVVALVDDEATVKRLRTSRGKLELLPENPAFKPILPSPDQCTLLGKVIEVRRSLEGA